MGSNENHFGGIVGCDLFSFCFLYMHIQCTIQDISSEDHSNYDCLFIALLSHGINGKLYSSDGVLIPVEKITGQVYNNKWLIKINLLYLYKETQRHFFGPQIKKVKWSTTVS